VGVSPLKIATKWQELAILVPKMAPKWSFINKIIKKNERKGSRYE